jgi:uncharacterized protein (TIGR02646 family)
MVELQHGVEPAELTAFRIVNTAASVTDFDSLEFQGAKKICKAALNQEQDGLCVYCEQLLAGTEGQIDHIKPKSVRPDLCFSYTNYAHSCINNKTCGQKKKNGLLPIEPAFGCNQEWRVSSMDGSIQPVLGLTRTRKHQVTKTRDMLGLNVDSNLLDERKKWFDQTLVILREAPTDIQLFLQTAPFRYILTASI